MTKNGKNSSRVFRILLVDDQPLMDTLLRRMLRSEPDLELHYCQFPVQALHMAELLRPAVILLDVVMPEVDGITLLRRFRRRRAFSQVPIVMLSSEEDPYIKAQAFAAGANNYLVKLPMSSKVEMVARLRHQASSFLDAARQPAGKESCFDIISSDFKGYWLVDSETKEIFDADETLCRMIGLPKERIIGCVPQEFVDMDNHAAMSKAVNWIPKVDNRIHELFLVGGMVLNRSIPVFV